MGMQKNKKLYSFIIIAVTCIFCVHGFAVVVVSYRLDVFIDSINHFMCSDHTVKLFIFFIIPSLTLPADLALNTNN